MINVVISNLTVSSVKANILFDGAITAKVKLFLLSCNETPDYVHRRI